MPSPARSAKRDKTPLLLTSSNSDGNDTAPTDPPARARQSGIRRLFSRSDPPGDRQKAKVQTVDTRSIVKKQQDPTAGVGPLINIKPVKENTINKTPPRHLKENSRDSVRKKRQFLLPEVKDPPAHNGASDSVQLTGTNMKDATKQDLGGNTPSNSTLSRSTMTDSFTTFTASRSTASSFAKFPSHVGESDTLSKDEKKTDDPELDEQHLRVKLKNHIHHEIKRKHKATIRSTSRHGDSEKVGDMEVGENHGLPASQSSGENSEGTRESAGTSSYQILLGRNPEEGSLHDDSNQRHARDTSTIQKPSKPNTVRGLLARPFGRASLPPEIARKWVVEVSSAEWDAEEKRWKYRILIQRRLVGPKPKKGDAKRPQQSFTNAFTWRSLSDFCWLERAIREEYYGGLLLPDLSIALGRPLSDANLEETPVEAEMLRNWLGDVLNGIRGQGELLFDHSDQVVDLLKSESMEAFLYRNGGSSLQYSDATVNPETSRAPATPLRVDGDDSCEQPKGIFNRLNLLLSSPLELCVGPQPSGIPDFTSIRANIPSGSDLPIAVCQSRAVAPASTHSHKKPSPQSVSGVSILPTSSHVALHSELLEAERELIVHYRKRSLVAMERLASLQRVEESLGSSWQRFAISLANLFAFEKDVENIRFGELKSKREHMPYRKIVKKDVDDCLRILSRQKLNRALPGLDSLREMLSAYVADLSSVEPSVAVYFRVVDQLTRADDAPKGEPGGTVPVENVGQDTLAGASEDRMRFISNEKLLRQSLTTLCRSTTVRVARMAWRYLNTEASQCALVHSAAVALRKKVDTGSKSSIAKMLNRHHKEEKEDDIAEAAIVDRIVKLGSLSSSLASISNPSNSQHARDDRARARFRERVLESFRAKRGRWDASLAVSILEAVGVDDTNVNVDETSRELRMVRKFAVGLRENLTRCEEALNVFQEFSSGEAGAPLCESRIAAARNTFFKELSNVFNGGIASSDELDTAKRGTLATSLLSRAGIDTSDPFGWTPSTSATRTTFTQGRLGDLVNSYFRSRDSRIDWLLRSLSELLKDYNERVEIVEGFVFMECVGIQLEKHFSRMRSEALNAFETKADLTAALNVATKKRLKKLASELKEKLVDLGPGVSQTQVKESKEAHLESKEVKGLLHDLAIRRLNRARETSTERAVTILDFWAKEEENASARELKALGEAMNELERSFSKEDFDSLLYRYSRRSTG